MAIFQRSARRRERTWLPDVETTFSGWCASPILAVLGPVNRFWAAKPRELTDARWAKAAAL